MPSPPSPRAPEWLDLSEFGAVIFAGGFRPDYRSWLPWPEAFDELGFPYQRDGVSTVVPGLFFVGVHFLPARKSSLLFGVGEDAAIVSHQVRDLLASGTPRGVGRSVARHGLTGRQPDVCRTSSYAGTQRPTVSALLPPSC